ncbi:unnamed protein product [Parajaminaea phylloscopi]
MSEQESKASTSDVAGTYNGSNANETLLAAASRGDLATLKALFADDASTSDFQPWYESPSCLGWSALHFAAENGHTACIQYLLRNGALWNAVDVNGVTAAEVAWSNNWDRSYAALVEEGVRQGMLLGVLEDANGQGSSEIPDGDDDMQDTKSQGEAATSQGGQAVVDAEGEHVTLSAPSGEVANSNAAFLASRLRFFTDEKGKERCLDEDDNMVMAAWEGEIMRRTARALCEDHPARTEGLRVLNIGYGLGIVDDLFQTYKPSRHVIVEPHPDVVAFFESKPISSAPGVELVAKRWEDALSDYNLGEFDVIYADPYAQDYKDLRNFFDLVPNFLAGPEARFSFFHGLAGTNRFFYDVYTRLSELHLRDVGLETQWETVTVDLEDREEVWRGVKREYWSLDHFRLPICHMGVV